MTEEWMNDARKIPNEPMGYLRKLVVRAIAENAYSPELLADIFGLSRSSIYEWLKRYREIFSTATDFSVSAPNIFSRRPSQTCW